MKTISLDTVRTKIIPILERNDITYAGLFGSVARGDAREDSDIDIIVRYGKDKSLLDHIGIAYELEDILGRKVDLVTEKGLSKYVAPYIKRFKSTIWKNNETRFIVNTFSKQYLE